MSGPGDHLPVRLPPITSPAVVEKPKISSSDNPPPSPTISRSNTMEFVTPNKIVANTQSDAERGRRCPTAIFALYENMKRSGVNIDRTPTRSYSTEPRQRPAAVLPDNSAAPASATKADRESRVLFGRTAANQKTTLPYHPQLATTPFTRSLLHLSQGPQSASQLEEARAVLSKYDATSSRSSATPSKLSDVELAYALDSIKRRSQRKMGQLTSADEQQPVRTVATAHTSAMRSLELELKCSERRPFDELIAVFRKRLADGQPTSGDVVAASSDGQVKTQLNAEDHPVENTPMDDSAAGDSALQREVTAPSNPLKVDGLPASNRLQSLRQSIADYSITAPALGRVLQFVSSEYELFLAAVNTEFAVRPSVAAAEALESSASDIAVLNNKLKTAEAELAELAKANAKLTAESDQRARRNVELRERLAVYDAAYLELDSELQLGPEKLRKTLLDFQRTADKAPPSGKKSTNGASGVLAVESVSMELGVENRADMLQTFKKSLNKFLLQSRMSHELQRTVAAYKTIEAKKNSEINALQTYVYELERRYERQYTHCCEMRDKAVEVLRRDQHCSVLVNEAQQAATDTLFATQSLQLLELERVVHRIVFSGGRNQNYNGATTPGASKQSTAVTPVAHSPPLSPSNASNKKNPTLLASPLFVDSYAARVRPTVLPPVGATDTEQPALLSAVADLPLRPPRQPRKDEAAIVHPKTAVTVPFHLVIPPGQVQRQQGLDVDIAGRPAIIHRKLPGLDVAKVAREVLNDFRVNPKKYDREPPVLSKLDSSASQAASSSSLTVSQIQKAFSVKAPTYVGGEELAASVSGLDDPQLSNADGRPLFPCFFLKYARSLGGGKDGAVAEVAYGIVHAIQEEMQRHRFGFPAGEFLLRVMEGTLPIELANVVEELVDAVKFLVTTLTDNEAVDDSPPGTEPVERTSEDKRARLSKIVYVLKQSKKMQLLTRTCEDILGSSSPQQAAPEDDEAVSEGSRTPQGEGPTLTLWNAPYQLNDDDYSLLTHLLSDDSSGAFQQQGGETAMVSVMWRLVMLRYDHFIAQLLCDLDKFVVTEVDCEKLRFVVLRNLGNDVPASATGEHDALNPESLTESVTMRFTTARSAPLSVRKASLVGDDEDREVFKFTSFICKHAQSVGYSQRAASVVAHEALNQLRWSLLEQYLEGTKDHAPPTDSEAEAADPAVVLPAPTLSQVTTALHKATLQVYPFAAF